MMWDPTPPPHYRIGEGVYVTYHVHKHILSHIIYPKKYLTNPSNLDPKAKYDVGIPPLHHPLGSERVPTKKALETSDHHNFLIHSWILTNDPSIFICVSCRCEWTTHLPHSG